MVGNQTRMSDAALEERASKFLHTSYVGSSFVYDARQLIRDMRERIIEPERVTPGTVEVCGLCRRENEDVGADGLWEYCARSECPIKRAHSPQRRRVSDGQHHAGSRWSMENSPAKALAGKEASMTPDNAELLRACDDVLQWFSESTLLMPERIKIVASALKSHLTTAHVGGAGGAPWQLIETAPRDGTEVLLWIDTDADENEGAGGQFTAYAISGFHSARAWRTQFHVTAKPTHWRLINKPGEQGG